MSAFIYVIEEVFYVKPKLLRRVQKLEKTHWIRKLKLNCWWCNNCIENKKRHRNENNRLNKMDEQNRKWHTQHTMTSYTPWRKDEWHHKFHVEWAQAPDMQATTNKWNMHMNNHTKPAYNHTQMLSTTSTHDNDTATSIKNGRCTRQKQNCECVWRSVTGNW
jgi:hypothetical protein